MDINDRKYFVFESLTNIVALFYDCKLWYTF